MTQRERESMEACKAADAITSYDRGIAALTLEREYLDGLMTESQANADLWSLWFRCGSRATTLRKVARRTFGWN